MSANLIVDLGGTAFSYPSILGTSGVLQPASGVVIGQTVDLINANTYTNICVVGQSVSGQLRVGVQTSDSDTSGSFTDPTSGLPQLPTSFQSGGIIWINSGGASNGVLAGVASGYNIASGFTAFAAFQRPHRYARAWVPVADVGFNGPGTVSFVGQLKTTGSGGGFTFNPTSGTVSV